MGAGKSKATVYSIGSSTSTEYTETFFDNQDYQNINSFLDNIEYNLYENNPEWYGEEYLQELRDLGINIQMDSNDGIEGLRKEYDFLGSFSDEEIQYMMEHFNGDIRNGDSLSTRVASYYSGDLVNVSDIEKSIFEKYWEADLGARTAKKFADSLSQFGQNTSFKGHIQRFIEEGYGDNINVGMSIKMLYTLTKIGLENGVPLLKSFGIRDMNQGNDGGKLGGSYFRFGDTLTLDINSFGKPSGDSNLSSWSVPSVVGYGVAHTMHEFGHHIEDKLFNFDSGKKIKGDNAVSVYGNTSYNEAFAESFVAYCLGIEPNRGKEYHSNFKKLMSESGLSAYEGCVKKLK